MCGHPHRGSAVTFTYASYRYHKISMSKIGFISYQQQFQTNKINKSIKVYRNKNKYIDIHIRLPFQAKLVLTPYFWYDTMN